MENNPAYYEKFANYWRKNIGPQMEKQSSLFVRIMTDEEKSFYDRITSLLNRERGWGAKFRIWNFSKKSFLFWYKRVNLPAR